MIFTVVQKLKSIENSILAFLSVFIYLGYVWPAGVSNISKILAVSENVQKIFQNDFQVFFENSSFWKNKNVTTQIANQTRKKSFQNIFWNLWNILIDKKNQLDFA